MDREGPRLPESGGLVLVPEARVLPASPAPPPPQHPVFRNGRKESSGCWGRDPSLGEEGAGPGPSGGVLGLRVGRTAVASWVSRLCSRHRPQTRLLFRCPQGWHMGCWDLSWLSGAEWHWDPRLAAWRGSGRWTHELEEDVGALQGHRGVTVQTVPPTCPLRSPQTSPGSPTIRRGSLAPCTSCHFPGGEPLTPGSSQAVDSSGQAPHPLVTGLDAHRLARSTCKMSECGGQLGACARAWA